MTVIYFAIFVFQSLSRILSQISLKFDNAFGYVKNAFLKIYLKVVYLISHIAPNKLNRHFRFVKENINTVLRLHV